LGKAGIALKRINGNPCNGRIETLRGRAYYLRRCSRSFPRN
jgi:hypothetical protein